ncbi:Cytochrome P450 [Thermomonospora echinospora]|uniref:Cytochrome P450 n=1 Tax=Thermomonospora echinospora TaxID=1992 RepID=A0A1H6D7U8_9ACTN|nr:cytochrome P450 [Thermomonospora echinospora]SEG81369.1 Cytochrome P450 [Thermomonospora echinospora]
MDHQPTSVYSPLTLAATEPLLTRDFDARPALVYERLRAKYGAVAPVDVHGVPAWMVLGYAEALEVLRNERGVWSKSIDNWRAYAEGRVPADWALLPFHASGGVPYTSGRVHAHLRGAWTTALRPFQDRTQPQARRMESEVRRYADELISLMAAGGRSGWADLSAQYSRPLIVMVFNLLVGFGAATDDVLMDMWRLMDGTPDSAEAMVRLTEMIGQAVTAKDRQPGDDLPSYMMAAGLTVEQATTETIMLMGALGDMTSSLICNAIVEVILDTAGARASLAAGMIRETVNRAAMASPPNPNLTFRYATADTMIGDTAIAAGDPVMLSLAAAHADHRFADPLDLSSVHSSRAHLSWGAGAHQCPADDLATTLVSIAVERLFERMAALELALPPDQLPWRSSLVMRGLRSLPVRFQVVESFTPSARAGSLGATGEPGGAEAGQSLQGGSRSALTRLMRSLLRQSSR